jgi:hypothetical protein
MAMKVRIQESVYPSVSKPAPTICSVMVAAHKGVNLAWAAEARVMEDARLQASLGTGLAGEAIRERKN